MKISVVTAVLNDLQGLKVTYDSVLSQKNEDYEFVIVDGCSTDGTIEFVETISKSDDRIKYISENDSGIYNALNKGVLLASGDYVVFLGAGDQFYSENTLEEISEYFDYDIIYGKVIFSSGKNKGKIAGSKVDNLTLMTSKTVAHQSVFSKRELLIKYPFDESLYLLADQDFMLKVYFNKYKLIYLNKVIACYDGMGVSSEITNFNLILKERLTIIKKYSLFLFYLKRLFYKFRYHYEINNKGE